MKSFVKIFLVCTFFSCEGHLEEDSTVEPVEEVRIYAAVLELNEPLPKTFFEGLGALNSLEQEGCPGYFLYAKEILEESAIIYYLCRNDTLIAVKVESEKGIESILEDNSHNFGLEIRIDTLEKPSVVIYGIDEESNCTNTFFLSW